MISPVQIKKLIFKRHEKIKQRHNLK